MGLFNRVFGNETRETHNDGSTTDRNSNKGTSVTRNSDGSLREYSYESDPLIGPKTVVTKNSDGKTINSQRKY